MDVERTIEFLLEHGAKVDTRLDALSKLVQSGINMLLDFQAENRARTNALIDAQMRTEAKLEQLAEAQRLTEQKFQVFLDSLRRPNGGSR
ncbi:MAG TPA: hypothetical protein VFL57_17275 [Bryobacteraceae bacterium]|nr:hypothetical protein [Bryobacteraceae bacterium]